MLGWAGRGCCDGTQGLQHQLRFACSEGSTSSGSAIIARYMICTSACFEEAACVLACEKVLHGGHILLSGVAKQSETDINQGKHAAWQGSSGNSGLAFCSPCFPRNLSNLSIFHKIILTNWRNGLEEIGCNLIEISTGFYI